MSEYILCKGKKPLCFTNRITICDLDDFLIGKAKEIWWTANSVWTIEIDNHELDDVLTEAQEVFNPSSALLQSMRKSILSNVVISILLQYWLYVAYISFIPFRPFVFITDKPVVLINYCVS